MSDSEEERQEAARLELVKQQLAERNGFTEEKLKNHTLLKTIKKTPFQKHKEELEAKKKKEIEDAAKVLDEFVNSFDQEGSRSNIKTFVRGGIIEHNDKKRKDAESEPPERSSSSRLYAPTVKKPPPKRMSSSEPEDKPKQPEPHIMTKDGKKRNLDSFMEELKRGQEEREARLKSRKGSDKAPVPETRNFEPSMTMQAAFEGASGSHDLGDPDTTNLYVGNLNPQVNEERLCQEFGPHGPLASVKIMWPRTQEEIERNRNCGFVSFMHRKDAERALKAMDGFDLIGYIMKVGWGKAVPLPEKPIYVHRDCGAPVPPTGLPFNAQVVPQMPGAANAAKLEVVVQRPTDPKILAIIHRTIEFLLIYGPGFESELMRREKNNPDYAFLFKHDNPNHLYYRWRVFSLLSGDTVSRWREDPFMMFEPGAYWLPPRPTAEETSSFAQDDIISEVSGPSGRGSHVQKGNLPSRSRGKLNALINNLSIERMSVAVAMAFVLDHADAADEITAILCDSVIKADKDELGTKITRLYLVSDVLHNSAATIPNAWKLRTALEPRLPAVFDHLAEIYRGIGARLKSENFKKQILTVLRIWETWLVFPQTYLQSLTEAFVKASTFKSSDNRTPEATNVPSVKVEEPAQAVSFDSSDPARQADEIAERKVHELRQFLESKGIFPVPVMVDRAEAYRSMILKTLEAKFMGIRPEQPTSSGKSAESSRKRTFDEMKIDNNEEREETAEDLGATNSGGRVKRPRKGDEDGIALR